MSLFEEQENAGKCYQSEIRMEKMVCVSITVSVQCIMDAIIQHTRRVSASGIVKTQLVN